MATYTITTTSPAIRTRYGLFRNPTVQANSEFAARQYAAQYTGAPFAILGASEIAPALARSGKVTLPDGTRANMPPLESVPEVISDIQKRSGTLATGPNVAQGEQWSPSGIAPMGTGANIGGFYSTQTPGTDLPAWSGSNVPGFNLPYRGSGQTGGGELSDFEEPGLSFLYDPSGGGEGVYSQPPSVVNPAAIDALVASQAQEPTTAQVQQAKLDKEKEAKASQEKEPDFMTGAIRPWDERVKDIRFVGAKGARTPVLPPDMFRWNNKNPMAIKN